MACLLTSAPDEDFAAMSEYSLDSLESVEDDSLEKRVSINSDNNDNLGTIRFNDRSIKTASSQLNSTSSSKIKGMKNHLNSIRIASDRKGLNNDCNVQ